MKSIILIVVIVMSILMVNVKSQRSPYAGARPSGYKDRFSVTPEPQQELANRFGENDINNVPTSTIRLPYDAYGDTFVVNQLNARPVDQRPFWLINYEAIEAHRNATRPNFNGPVQSGSRSSFLGKK